MRKKVSFYNNELAEVLVQVEKEKIKMEKRKSAKEIHDTEKSHALEEVQKVKERLSEIKIKQEELSSKQKLALREIDLEYGPKERELKKKLSVLTNQLKENERKATIMENETENRHQKVCFFISIIFSCCDSHEISEIFIAFILDTK